MTTEDRHTHWQTIIDNQAESGWPGDLDIAPETLYDRSIPYVPQ